MDTRSRLIGLLRQRATEQGRGGARHGRRHHSRSRSHRRGGEGGFSFGSLKPYLKKAATGCATGAFAALRGGDGGYLSGGSRRSRRSSRGRSHHSRRGGAMVAGEGGFSFGSLKPYLKRAATGCAMGAINSLRGGDGGYLSGGSRRRKPRSHHRRGGAQVAGAQVAGEGGFFGPLAIAGLGYKLYKLIKNRRGGGARTPHGFDGGYLSGGARASKGVRRRGGEGGTLRDVIHDVRGWLTGPLTGGRYRRKGGEGGMDFARLARGIRKGTRHGGASFGPMPDMHSQYPRQGGRAMLPGEAAYMTPEARQALYAAHLMAGGALSAKQFFSGLGKGLLKGLEFVAGDGGARASIVHPGMTAAHYNLYRSGAARTARVHLHARGGGSKAGASHSPWVAFLHKWAAARGMSYSAAISDPGASEVYKHLKAQAMMGRR